MLFKYCVTNQSAVHSPEKTEIFDFSKGVLRTYFFEDPRKLTQFASWRMLIFGIGSPQKSK